MYCTLLGSPIGHTRLVERHEIDLARGSTLGRGEKYLIVALAQELQLLRFLVHKYAVQVARLYRPDFNGLIAPAHDLTRANVGYRSGQFAPLQYDVLGDFSVGVDVDALVVITEQKLHAIGVGQGDNGVGNDGALSVLWCVNIVDLGRVEVDGVETVGGAVENLETGALFHGEINQERLVLQLAE